MKPLLLIVLYFLVSNVMGQKPILTTSKIDSLCYAIDTSANVLRFSEVGPIKIFDKNKKLVSEGKFTREYVYDSITHKLLKVRNTGTAEYQTKQIYYFSDTELIYMTFSKWKTNENLITSNADLYFQNDQLIRKNENNIHFDAEVVLKIAHSFLQKQYSEN